MKRVWMRLVALAACAVLLMTMTPAVRAESTTLEVDFRGLTALAGGEWRAEELSGSFEVTRDGQSVGTISTGEGSKGLLSLKGNGNAQLVPDMSTMPKGYLIQLSGYSASITEGELNTALVMVYADAGLFTLQAESKSSFTLLNELGESVMSFETDDTGAYALPEALPSGAYTLRQDSAAAGTEPWADCILTLTAYRGDKQQIVHVDAAYARENAAATPTPVPTATLSPTPASTLTPTMKPTAEPTAAPNQEPTEATTAEPTEQPTAEPTATPVPQSTLILTLLGEGDAVRYTVTAAADTPEAQTLAEDTLNVGMTAEIPGLTEGVYMMTVTLPEGTLACGLNGLSAMTRNVAEWKAVMTPGEDSLYQLTLCRTGALAGTAEGVADGVLLAVRGEKDAADVALAEEAYIADGLCPGVYSLTVSLPAGRYEGDGWQLTQENGGVTARIDVTVGSGETTDVPALRRVVSGSLSGIAARSDGLPLGGAQVFLLTAAGEKIASTVCDEAGAWRFDGLESGDYVLQLDSQEDMPSMAQQVSLGEDEQAEDIRLTAGRPAELRVGVYHDKNNNGERAGNESGLEGATVSVLNETGATVASARTDADGMAVLSDVPEGVYTVRIELVSGYGFGKTGTRGKEYSSVTSPDISLVQDVPDVTLSADAPRTMGVSAVRMAAVSGKAWYDENGDGIMQEDEPGQAGVLIELIGTINGLTYEYVTDETGLFYIGQVKPSTYKMRVTAPEGTMFTKYSKTGGAYRSYFANPGKRTDTRTFDLKAGQVFDQRYIGLMADGVIELTCFLDVNYNGLYDEGEQLLPGVECDAIRVSNGQLMASDVSDENGVATLSALRAADYNIHCLLPKGYTYTCVTEQEGGNRFASRDGRREYTVTGVPVTAGETVKMVVGAIAPATITGTAYLDDDFSATRNGKEETVSGLILALLDENGEQVDVTRSNAKGVYTFEGVTPGNYSIRLEAKRGYAFTCLGDGNAFLNIGDGRGQTELFFVALGESVTKDVGMILPGTVQGSVFADANDNGLWDEGEGGFEGATVRLMDESGEVFAAQLGEDGAFCFDAVMPGRYYLRYELPEGSAFSRVTGGGNTVAGENDVGAGEWFDFQVAQQVEAPLCGGLRLSEISGTAFADHNGSGLMDEGEAPLAGVIIALTPSRSDLEAVTAVTGTDGSFALSGLHPDQYTLTLTYPEGMAASRTTETQLPIVPGTGIQSAALEVRMGDRWVGQAMGVVYPAALRGRAWLDENNDGMLDEGECAPAGGQVTVTDDLSGNVAAVMTIGEDGSFGAENLVPGSYTLQYGPAVEGCAGDSTFTFEDGVLVMRGVHLGEGDDLDGALLGVVCHTSIAGNVWVDLGSEVTALAGAEMMLLDENGAVLATCASDETGAYRFDGLMPGRYILQASLPEGQVVVRPDDERLTDGGLCSVMMQCSGRTGQSGTIELKMGRDLMDMNVGGVLPGTLGDLCWLDENGNGLQDSGEMGIPGVVIELVRGGETVAQTVSDQYGYYRFRDVYPAVYILQVTAPDEVKPTQHREDVPLAASVLLEGEGSVCVTGEVTVESDTDCRNADLGFVLREQGKYPAGYGEGATQDWTKPGKDD